jgi:hypothetical protein
MMLSGVLEIGYDGILSMPLNTDKRRHELFCAAYAFFHSDYTVRLYIES